MRLAFFQRLPASPLLLASTLFALGAAGIALAAASSATPWIASNNSKVRLVSGMVDNGGRPALLAGVQLRMDAGWKTYWRNPGDSGVPPSFNWAGSKNLKEAEVLFPAPDRFADAGGTAIGYDGEVLFPVKLTPEREAVSSRLSCETRARSSIFSPTGRSARTPAMSLAFASMAQLRADAPSEGRWAPKSLR